MKDDTKIFILTIIATFMLAFWVFAIFAPKAEAQQISSEEVCMDIAASASTIAHYRDSGISPRVFALSMINKYDNGLIDYQMLDNVSKIALLVYQDWAYLTPTQVGVEAHRTCLQVSQ